jgi:SulP family sulfate permease
MVALYPDMKHFILMCSAINSIDASGLESLKSINQRLAESGIVFHLSEVKGPIMDSLKKTKFYEEIKERIHLTQFEAVSNINPEL